MTSFDKWYKHSIESRQEDPPEALWDAIQNDLDVEQVWTRLDHALPLNNKKPFYAILAVAASLALLISAGIWMFNRPGNVMPEISTPSLAAYKLNSIERMAVGPLGETLERDIIIRPEEIMIPTPESSVSQWPAFTEISSYAHISRPAVFISYTEPDRQMLLAERSLPSSERSLYADMDISEDARKNNTSWQIGVTGQLANTWMVNTKTIEGLQSDHLTTTNATFGNNIGLHATWVLNQRYKIKNEWQILSRTGQSYQEYINGQYVATSLDLNYINTAILFYYHPFEKKRPHAVALGLYAGMLQEATRQKNGDLERITGDYARFDYGLLLGYEYEHRLKKGFSLSSGIYTRYGLTNIFAGNQIVPAYLNQTRNAAFLLSFSLNYQLQ